MARKARPYWVCRKCKYRNPSIKRKCLDCGTLKAKKKVNPKSKPVDAYEHYRRVAEVLHGVHDERCCVCGKPKQDGRKHDRDHDHRNGNPRGLVCPLDNMLMKFTQLDAARAKLIWQYLERAEKYPEFFTKPEGLVETEQATES
jgi:hypothetical protein